MDRRETLLDLWNSFRGLQDPFLISDDGLRIRRYTYRDTGGAAAALAGRMAAAGVRKGDKVLLWSENRAEWVAAFWAAMQLGAVVTPVDYRASFALVEQIQAQVHAKVVLIGDRVVWPYREDSDMHPWRLAEVVDWGAAAGGVWTPADVAGADLAEIIFTSGTTGDPKGVLLTHRNILANLQPVEREILKYRRWGTPFYPLRFLNLLPLSHMFGQAMSMLIPPMLPGVTMFLESQDPAEIASRVRAERVSVIVAVPRMLEILKTYVEMQFPEAAVERVDAAGRWPKRWWRYRRIHRLFGWKFWAFVVGAAPLPEETESFWSR